MAASTSLPHALAERFGAGPTKNETPDGEVIHTNLELTLNNARSINPNYDKKFLEEAKEEKSEKNKPGQGSR